MDALGAEVAQRALADMGRSLRIDTPTIVLVCKYVGTEEEDAPLNSISRVKYEWCLADFGGAHDGRAGGQVAPFEALRANRAQDTIVVCLLAG